MKSGNEFIKPVAPAAAKDEAGSAASADSKNIELEHSFVKRQLNSKSQLFCEHCKIKISNQKYYLFCHECNINVHEKCSNLINKNCRPIEVDTTPEPMPVDAESDEVASNGDDQHQQQQQQQMSTATNNNSNSNSNSGNKKEITMAELDFKKMSIDEEIDTSQIVSTKNDLPEAKAADTSADVEAMDESENKIDDDMSRFKGPRSQRRTQINLQRISQRVKKTNGCFWHGHMVYYTNLNPEVKKNHSPLLFFFFLFFF